MIRTPPAAFPVGFQDASGPLVAFVHGMEDDWRTWSRVARYLGPGWRAVAMDMPWRAGNDYRWRWFGSPAAWLAAGLDALGEAPSVLVGHSFGANAVLARLATDPEPPADCAVLVAPFYWPPGHPVSWETFDRSRATFERQIGDGMRTRLGARAAPLHPEVFDAMLAKTCERIGPVGFLAAFEQYLASGHLPLSEVSTPTLVLGGERDPGATRRHLEALAARLPRGAVVYRPDQDHFGHLRLAAEVAMTIVDFVAETCGSRTGPEQTTGA